jgi:HPt (histidine-containing phosphotransfer) domain-containing protein
MEVINLEKAVRLMDGDQELFGDLFEIIESSLPEKYRAIETAMANDSAVDLELYAHQLKGALRNVAADEVCALLEKLEKSGARNDFASAREIYPRLKPMVDQVLEYYRSRVWASAFAK